MKILHSFLFAFIVLGMMAAIAGPQADKDLAAIQEHMKSNTEWTWVFYGDSITHGAKHTYGWRSFPEVFAERLRWELHKYMDIVINSGISGNGTGTLLNDHNYERRVARFKPNVVLVLSGINDIVSVTPDVTKNLVTQLIQKLRADGIIPVLQTYNTIQLAENPNNDYLRRTVIRYHRMEGLTQALREVAAEQDVILVDHYAHWQTVAADPAVQNFWLGETIHPGAKGHLEMANEILKVLGLYEPVGTCSTVAAGGTPPPEVAAAMKRAKDAELAKFMADPKVKKLYDALAAIDAFDGWRVVYDAAKGLPHAAAWDKGQYPDGAFSMVEMDGKPALKVDNTVNGEKYALLTYKDTAALSNLKGILRFDAEIALLPPFPVGNSFYAGFATPAGDHFAQMIFAYGRDSLIGTFPRPANFKVEPGKFVRVTMLLDSETSCGLIRFGDEVTFCKDLRPLTDKAQYACFGDGGQSISGVFALRYMKMGGD